MQWWTSPLKRRKKWTNKLGKWTDRFKGGLTETAQRILELIKQDPTITYDKIAAELGKARSGIAKQIKKLIDDGIVLPKEKNNGVWTVK